MSSLKEFQGIEGADFFELDPGFQTLLKNLLPADTHDAIFNSLHHCGRLVAGRWNDLAREANKHEHLPKIVKFDRAGNAVEQVDYGTHARHLRREVAEFGVLTDARNELHKFAIVYLLAHNGEGSVNCGLSCTDGLIRAIEAVGSEFLRETYLPLLRSAETPVAGAQFITEAGAGSDVGAVETEARPNPDGTWSITGEKWFCSNPDEYFLVGARPVDAPSGTALSTARRLAARRGEKPFAHKKAEKETLPGTRGGEEGNVAVHSVRLPGFVADQEVIFGLPGQTLTIAHRTTSREAYVPGVLLAIRHVTSGPRFYRGLDQLLGLRID